MGGIEGGFAETERERLRMKKGEILRASTVFFNLLFSCIGTGVSSVGIKNPDRVMELGADPEGGRGLEEERGRNKINHLCGMKERQTETQRGG